MKARPSLSFQAIIDVAQGKFIILKMRANIKRGGDFRRLKSVKSSFHFFRRLSRGEVKDMRTTHAMTIVIYLSKEVYRKIMSEIHSVGKTRYEDLTETGS